jgi:CRISPR/Cas system-associated exonuclease Cas4 (RecB family)
MSRTLIVGGPVRKLHARAAEFLRDHASAEVLILAPSRAAADDFVRESLPKGGLGIHRLTPLQLAGALALNAMSSRGLAPLPHLGSEALAARTAHLSAREGELAYFEPVARLPGFPRALAATVSELRKFGVPAETLIETGPPGADLARLSDRYCELLETSRLGDVTTTLHLAAEEARGSAHRLLGLPLLLLDPVIEPGSALSRLVEAVTARAPRALAVVLGQDEATQAALEPSLGPAQPLQPSDHPRRSLDALRENLFIPGRLEAPQRDSSLDLFSAPGEGLECVEIARRIQALAREGARYDRIAILLRGPDRYQPLVEEALRRAGVPGYFSKGTIRPDPSGCAFLALLSCAAEGCAATRFAEYLSLAQVPPLDADGASIRQERAWASSQDEFLSGFGGEPLPDPEISVEPALEAPVGWERLLVDAAVVGGSARWARRLDGLATELRLQIERSDDSSSPARRLHQLQRLQRFALPLIQFLSDLPAKATWGEWLEHLTVLAQRALRSPESVLGTIDELRPMADVGPVDVEEVYGVLSERLRFLRRDPPQRRYGRVFVGMIEEARARDFDTVFVPGLAEGLFPRRAFEDPLLLDSSREAIAAGSGCRLPTLAVRVAQERLSLHTAAAAAGERLIVSYPRLEAVQSRQRVPSFYALETVRAAEGQLPDLRLFERQAMEAASARLGWPAPEHPSLALDDAEFDLSTLDLARRLPAGEGRGMGRYLITTSSTLARAMRFRWRRWHRKWSAADGLVADDDKIALDLLHRHRLDRRSFSPTALQRYARCPYQFYLHTIAVLRPREESVPLEQMDPLTRGALFHDVLFTLFRELSEGDLLPVRQERAAEILDRADSVLNRIGASYADDLAPAIPRVWESEVEDVRTDLRGWVRHTLQPASEWRPHKFELAFGLGEDDRTERDPDSRKEDISILGGSLRLRGSVDLVERSVKRPVLRVVDHKTGRAPEPLPGYVGGGRFLQPLLYALAVEKILGETVEMGLLSYCTQRGGYTDVKIEVSPTARERIAEAIGHLSRAIEEGLLPAAPDRGACEYCDYRPVCGPYEEQRVRRKPLDRIGGLIQLRKLP